MVRNKQHRARESQNSAQRPKGGHREKSKKRKSNGTREKGNRLGKARGVNPPVQKHIKKSQQIKKGT